MKSRALVLSTVPDGGGRAAITRGACVPTACARTGRFFGSGAFANAALAMGAIVLTLCFGLAIEWALRLAEPRYLDRFALDDMSYLHAYSETYGWAPRAGFRSAPGQGPKITINDAGYRGREYPSKRSPGKSRVLMLGDSIAFGYGVADGETSSRQLEEIEPGLEVVNLAVQGYGTDQALLRFEREGLLFHPDVAILNFCLANDFRDNAARRAIYDEAYPKPYFTLERAGLAEHREGLGLSLLARLGLFLHQRSVVFNFLQRAARTPQNGTARPSAEHPPDREVTIALLRRLAARAHEHGVRLIVVLYPTYREFLKPSRRPKVLLETLASEDVIGLDLRPLLEARGVNRETYSQYALDGSFHPTARGNRVIAQILSDLLRGAGIVRDHPVLSSK